MKNIKNILAATVLAAVMGVSTVSASDGMILSGISAGGDNNIPTCASSNDGVLSELMGIIIYGATSSATGIIIYGRDGILIHDRSANGCQSTQNRDGILIHD